MKAFKNVLVLSLIFLFMVLLNYYLFKEISNDLKLNQIRFNSELSVDLYSDFSQQDFDASSRLLEFVLRDVSLRSDLRDQDINDLAEAYKVALKTKPSWPYYYTGYVQAHSRLIDVDHQMLVKAIQYGPHEVKIVKSVAELLFYNWSAISVDLQSKYMQYLSDQTTNNINQSVHIADRYGRLYEFCDWLYESTSIGFHACKVQKWSPLVQN